jgi:type II secretory pathway pseudopilin PulG
MNTIAGRTLTATRPFITGLLFLNTLYGSCLVVLLVISVVAPLVRPGWPWAALGFDMEAAHAALELALQLIAVLGLAGAALVHIVLRKLRAIADTVRDGDPFSSANARRLTTIAWCVLTGQVLRLAIKLIAAAVSTQAQPVAMGDGFSFAPWLAALSLFVLASVFAQGARMRADLEGTV